MVYIGSHDERPCRLERKSPPVPPYCHLLTSLQVVTSYSTSTAKTFGKDKSEALKPSAERYEAATEYMDVCYQLWEKSWEDGAPTWQVEPEMAYDPRKIHSIDYKGQHHQLFAYGATHPSPLRTPVIFQAGASKSGIDFAGKHAEAIYTDYSTIPMLKEYVEQVRAAAVKHGRAPTDVKIFAAMCPILGRTLEEAQAKHDKAFSLVSIQSGMAKFGGYTNIDLSKYPLKEPINIEAEEADNLVIGVLKDFMSGRRGRRSRLRRRVLGERVALIRRRSLLARRRWWWMSSRVGLRRRELWV